MEPSEKESGQPEFWEAAFTDKKEMWGFEPAASAHIARDLFLEAGVQHVLIPGIGYGRNAQIFRGHGMMVTGIEISKTAIEMAAKHFGNDIIIHHGSVTDMPFDQLLYDGIFCHALIHLLDSDERAKLIRDCYAQLKPDGLMLFSVISKEAATYGQGTLISTDRYEMFGGVRLFFYDTHTIQQEFGEAGLSQIMEVQENYPFHLIVCRKSQK